MFKNTHTLLKVTRQLDFEDCAGVECLRVLDKWNVAQLVFHLHRPPGPAQKVPGYPAHLPVHAGGALVLPFGALTGGLR